MASKTDYSSIGLIRHVVYVGKKDIKTRAPRSNYESLMMTRVTLKHFTMVIMPVKQGSRSSTQRK